MRGRRFLGFLASRRKAWDRELVIEVHRVNTGSTVIRPVGHVDLASSPLLRRALTDLVAEGRDLRVDLSGVRKMHSSGVAILVEGFHAARGNGTRFALVGVNGTLLRLLELARLETLLPIPRNTASVPTGTVDRPLAVAA